MKILFLLFHGFYATNGISKKVIAQIEALEHDGATVNVCHYNVTSDGHRQWKVDSQILKDLGTGLTAKLLKRIYFRPILDYIKETRPDYLYLRSFHNANPITINFLNRVRKTGTRIILEIPTYPYDGEYKTLWQKNLLLTDKLFRKSLCKRVEKIVTFSEDDIIFGRPTIRISNGIDLSKIPLKKTASHPGEVHLLGVAEIHFWHGFDRILSGLREYYRDSDPQTKVFFHIVGQPYGEEEKRSIRRGEKGIEKYVIKHGSLYGEALTEVFDACDIGIGSLGRHRSGVYTMKSLKNREYAARGMAFVYSENDPDFDTEAFVMKVPADETPVNIRDIVDFSKKSFAPEDIRKKTEHLSWDAQMLKVLNSLR